MKKSLMFLFCFIAINTWAKQPNIIVIMADDMGYADAGFTGATDIKTPNLDNIAKSGIVFDKGYVTHPYCGPSRAGFLAGRYQHRFGFDTNPAHDNANPILGIDVKEKLFPKRLQEAGYVTGGIGKWHLGTHANFHPNNRGFDYFYGFLGGSHDYFDIDTTQPIRNGSKDILIRNKRAANFDGYLTTALSNDAVNFIENNKTSPFFLYLAYNAPHSPLQAPKEDIARYSHIKDKKRRIYAAMVDVMDRGIGKVVNTLKANDLYDNTLIFFLSDNGGPVTKKSNGSSNGRFRDGKGSHYEGGVHVPFIASWPAVIKGGERYSEVVSSLDISRTAVDVAGGNAGGGNAMEGVNLIPFVTGKQPGPPHDALFWKGGKKGTVLRNDGNKLIDVKSKSKGELFYLYEDMSETDNLIKQQPELAKLLRAQWLTWEKGNSPGRMLQHAAYDNKRAAFFVDVVPAAALKAGYNPVLKKKKGKKK